MALFPMVTGGGSLSVTELFRQVSSQSFALENGGFYLITGYTGYGVPIYISGANALCQETWSFSSAYCHVLIIQMTSNTLTVNTNAISIFKLDV